ncbi:hypothetical protein AC579_54 [Pseudocercospora musae]|uniref:SnoaL-like domain-containing protein n=1 Tax=Pseudocercospora musae TaxID=113226 RepID=A0A139IA69_9PEZI|nr:hypothetical protein AC579_54 [Pseudocercospora musae]
MANLADISVPSTDSPQKTEPTKRGTLGLGHAAELMSKETQAASLAFTPQPFLFDVTKTPLADYLQIMAQRVLEAPNWMSSRDYEIVIRLFCAPIFRVSAGFPETNLIATNVEDHIKNFQAFLRANPKYRVEVRNTSISLDERMGRAIVFMSTKVSGLFASSETTRESVNKVHWKRLSNGRWQSVELSSLRGPGICPSRITFCISWSSTASFDRLIPVLGTL